MHAILISEENADKIAESEVVSHCPLHTIYVYRNNIKNWYLISGYVDREGRYFDFATLPQYILDRNFEYDADKIRTDWDQIVRK